MADGIKDGQFRITTGGITQGIRDELGLSKEYCKTLGSVWNEIIAEFDNKENLQVEKNQNDTPDRTNDYLVHENAVIKFSKNSWQKIVSKVNNALGKNIKIQESESEKRVEQQQECSTIDNLLNKTQEEKVKAIKQMVENYVKNIENGTEILPDGIDKQKAIEFMRNADIPPQILEMKDMNQIKASLVEAMKQFSKTQNVEKPKKAEPPKELEEHYSQAKESAIKFLQSNPDLTFDSPYGDKISANELIKYIQNIQYENNPYGTARAGNIAEYDSNSSIDRSKLNAIWVNTNPSQINPNQTQTETIKLLIHEALHCAYSQQKSPNMPDTQLEEMSCEKQAIQTTAKIIEASNKKLENIMLYGKPLLELSTSKDIDIVLQNEFINKGYESRPKDLSGEVTVANHNIKNGAVVSINGQEVGKIGDGCFIDGISNNNIRITGNNFGGQIFFGNAQPPNSKEIAIQQNNEVIKGWFVELGQTK